MDYLQIFLPVSETNIAETWHGFYSKLTKGDTEIFNSPGKGVFYAKRTWWSRYDAFFWAC